MGDVTLNTELQKILDDMDSLDFTPKNNDEWWKTVTKYATEILPNEKGKKTLKSLLQGYWSGRKLSEKELIMMRGLSFIDTVHELGVENAASYIKEIQTELLERFNFQTGNVVEPEILGYLLERGMMERNPDYDEEFHNKAMKIVLSEKFNFVDDVQ